MGNTPLICGGRSGGHPGHQNFCYSLKEDGDWQFETQLKTARSRSADGDVIIDNKLVLAGGENAGGYLKTIEVVSPDFKSETLPISLPEMYGSCIVPWDTNSFMIIGGYGLPSGPRKQTVIINMDNYKDTTGPDLLTARNDFSCGTICVNGEDFIVVAGGFRAEKSTEYLPKTKDASGTWKKSKNWTVV